MALTSVSYTGNGSLTTYAVTFPYLNKSHVVVTLNGVVTTAFTFPTSASIQLTVAPASGVAISIRRVTPQTPLVDFVDGSTLTEALLDTATNQAIYIAQEAYEGVATSDTILSAVANSSASATSAATSATNSANSATSAASSASSATASATNAAISAASITPIDIQTNSAPTKTTLVDADLFPLTDSATSFSLKKTSWLNIKSSLKTYFDTLYAVIGAAVNTGRVQQIVSSQTGIVATGTTIVPADNTIPQNTEGDQYLTLVITPSNTSSTLEIDFTGYFSNNAQVFNAASLFKDSVANALTTAVFVNGAGLSCTVTLKHIMVAGTTSPITFKIRAGGSSGTLTFNGTGGVQQYGGVLNSRITIREYLP